MSTLDTAATSQVTHPDDSGATVTAALNRAAVGQISLDYYLPIFARFEAANRGGASWNWAACLYTLNWLIFRRMWGAAWAYAAAALISVGLLIVLGRLLPGFYGEQEIWLWGSFCIVFFLLPGVYGNPLLFAVTRKKVMHALTVSSTLKEACEKLSVEAASRRRFIWLVAINMLLASGVVGVGLVFPDFGAAAHRALFLDETVEEDGVADQKSTPPPALVPKTEPAQASVTQADMEVMDAAAVHYVPRRPLFVSATASAPKVTASAGVTQPSAPAPQTALPYFINVGLFANDSNARYAQAKLVDAGLVSLRHALTTSKGKLTRVRVGPFDSKAEADAAAQKIRELKLDAVVIRP